MQRVIYCVNYSIAQASPLHRLLWACSSAEHLGAIQYIRHQSTTIPSDWTRHSKTQFSLEPSYFSPLYHAHRRHAERDLRRHLAKQQLRAHNQLSLESDGFDQAQVRATVMHRVASMQRLAEELRQLGRQSIVPKCSSKDLALGHYSILEEETQARDKDAEAFHGLAQSPGSEWQHWKANFSGQYAGIPSLQPLHIIYTRSEGAGHPPLEQSSGVQGLAQSGSGHSTLPGQLKGKPSISGQGVARAAGLRKSSVADVRVARGQGRVFINNRPLDEFLADISVRMHVLQPFLVTSTVGQFDVVAQVSGGGPASMAQAVQHGIAKGLSLLVGQGKASQLVGMMDWDPRRVERKKPGRKKARKGFSYVRR